MGVFNSYNGVMAGQVGQPLAAVSERRRAALEEFRKFKGAGAGSGVTEVLEAQRELGALYEVPAESGNGQTLD